ncbi:hypothetical protein AVEN_23931-1 [Araneus ventricosus]|uniref:Uncharacterized protein n=1 Tax=Araneus ventricosus TaxID=182803 RepID=A0A4Y2HKK7_ARAVE|nr:hypothetical protein AVEN_23931-1 [Araneus ventricosus]
MFLDHDFVLLSLEKLIFLFEASLRLFWNGLLTFISWSDEETISDLELFPPESSYFHNTPVGGRLCHDGFSMQKDPNIWWKRDLSLVESGNTLAPCHRGPNMVRSSIGSTIVICW